MATKEKTQILKTLGKLNQADKKPPAPIVQEVKTEEPKKKAGRKSHRLDGVAYVRISPAIPVPLKKEMEMAMLTTHAETPTIDTFVSEAVRHYLNLKR